MNGLTELSVQDAAALSIHRGWCLGLHGLRAERLSPEAFMLLGRHRRLCLPWPLPLFPASIETAAAPPTTRRSLP